MNRQEFQDRYSQLAGRILSTLAAGNPGENIVFSPFSVISQLSVLADTARGKTREDILRALCGDISPEGLPEHLKQTKYELTKIDFASITAYEVPFGSRPFTPDYSRHVETADAVFVKAEEMKNIHPGFGDWFADMYGGTLIGTNNVDAAAEAWLAAMESGRLELREAAPSDTPLALASAVFFRAMWMVPCKNSQVKKRVFTNADKTKAKVNMMYSRETGYVETPLATGFIRDFQQCAYSFAALLPKQKGPEALNHVITTTSFRRILKRATDTSVRAGIPEFTLDTETSLQPACTALGLEETFTETASFPGLAAAGLPSKKIFHKAKLELNRHGASTEAAAPIPIPRNLPPDDEKEVILNRPFVFAILHRTMNIPVFVGVVSRMEDA